MAQNKKKQAELEKQFQLEQEALQKEKSNNIESMITLVIRDRFIAGGESWLAAESIIDLLALNGGMFLFDKYLGSKDKPHCTSRLMQFFEEGMQVRIKSLTLKFSFFPGDPGEDDDVFDDNWTAETEPVLRFK
jgi:hypothetical protein